MPTRRLPVALSEQEINQKGAALASLDGEKRQLLVERKAAARQYKLAIDEIDGRCAALATDIRNRAEMRPVDVYDSHDPRRLVVDTVRSDTGEVVGSRAMTQAERQMSFVVTDPPRPPAPAATPNAVPEPSSGAAEVNGIPAELAAAAATPVPTIVTIPVLTEEEWSAIRQRNAPLRRVSTPRLAAEAPPELDPAERRFSLLEIDEDPKPAAPEPEPEPEAKAGPPEAPPPAPATPSLDATALD